MPPCAGVDQRVAKGLRIQISIWAVGDGYPAAFHTTYSANVWGSPLKGFDNYHTAYEEKHLAYGHTDNLQDNVSRQLQEFIENLAPQVTNLQHVP